MSERAEQIFEIAKEIKRVLHDHALATPDSYAVGRLSFLAGSLPPSPAASHASELVSLANIFYSSRKHEKQFGGSAMVYTKMQNLVGRIEQTGRAIAEVEQNA